MDRLDAIYTNRKTKVIHKPIPMKRLLFMMLIVLCSIGLNAQIKGIDMENVVPINLDDTEELELEVWYRDKGNYFKTYNNSPVGIGHSSQDLIILLVKNKIEYPNTDEDNSIVASNIKSLLDFENLSASVRIEASEVEKIWLFPGYKLVWLVNKDNAAIYIISIEE